MKHSNAGKKIKEYCNLYDVSTVGFARMCRISASTISRLITEKTTIGMKTAKAIEKATHKVLLASDLLGLTEEVNDARPRKPQKGSKDDNMQEVLEKLSLLQETIEDVKEEVRRLEGMNSEEEGPFIFKIKGDAPDMGIMELVEEFSVSSLSSFLSMVAAKGPVEIIPPKEVLEEYEEFVLDGQRVVGVDPQPGEWLLVFHGKQETELVGNKGGET